MFSILRVIFKVVFKNFSFFPPASLSLFIHSFLTLFSLWPLCLFVTKRGRVYSRVVYQRVFVISIWLLCTLLGGEILFLVHICRGRNSLYLSFYYLLYLKGLMCFVHVFQVTGINVPSSSQLLWFMIGGDRAKRAFVYHAFMQPLCIV